MKSRTGFISNSSSCSFIVESRAKGHLPPLHGQHINRVTDAVEGIDFGIVSNDYASGYFVDENKNEERHVSVSRVRDENDNLLTIVSIELSKELIQKSEIDLIEETERIFSSIVGCLFDDDEGKIKLKNKEGILYYSQTAKSCGDGGWDGGDPSGYYAWSRDLLQEQTKAGTITLKGRRINTNIKCSFEEI